VVIASASRNFRKMGRLFRGELLSRAQIDHKTICRACTSPNVKHERLERRFKFQPVMKTSLRSGNELPDPPGW